MIIGDKVSYSSSFEEDKYYEVKKYKPQIISDESFDYVIDNHGTLFEFEQKVCQIIDDIKIKKLNNR